MHPALDALFIEHATPSQCSWQQAHSHAAPTAKFAAKSQQQTAIYRELLLAAEMEGQDPALNGRLDAIHQKLTTIDKTLPVVIRQIRDTTRAFRELDAEIAEAKRIILQRGAGVVYSTPILAPPAPSGSPTTSDAKTP